MKRHREAYTFSEKAAESVNNFLNSTVGSLLVTVVNMAIGFIPGVGPVLSLAMSLLVSAIKASTSVTKDLNNLDFAYLADAVDKASYDKNADSIGKNAVKILSFEIIWTMVNFGVSDKLFKGIGDKWTNLVMKEAGIDVAKVGKEAAEKMLGEIYSGLKGTIMSYWTTISQSTMEAAKILGTKGVMKALWFGANKVSGSIYKSVFELFSGKTDHIPEQKEIEAWWAEGLRELKTTGSLDGAAIPASLKDKINADYTLRKGITLDAATFKELVLLRTNLYARVTTGDTAALRKVDSSGDLYNTIRKAQEAVTQQMQAAS